MNLPNLLTLSRIPLTFVIVLLIYSRWPGAATLAFVLFVVCGLTDWLDGYVARKRGQVSNFGIFMDALADKISVLGVLVALTDAKLIWPESDLIPVLLFLLILTREFLITGMRLVAALQGVVVSAEKGGKQKTITQIVAIGAFLFIPMVERDLDPLTVRDLAPLGVWLRHVAFGFYLLATALTLLSGVRYFVKYRHIFREKRP
jgi:CDP-diacylglycerol--glycerol-3-phosphate 3-phosphatidyltransferase